MVQLTNNDPKPNKITNTSILLKLNDGHLFSSSSLSFWKSRNMTMASHISPMAWMKPFPSTTLHRFQPKPTLISITASLKKSPPQNFTLQKFVPISSCLAVLLWSSPGNVILINLSFAPFVMALYADLEFELYRFLIYFVYI